MNNLWNSAKDLPIQVGSEITGGFDVGFDAKIPEETKDGIMDFAYWAEDHFALPVTLWVDCKYRKYLINQAEKRCGYRFWWAEFKDYPQFDNPDDIPVIELAVNRPTEEILPAFIEAITMYYAWLSGKPLTDDPALTETILRRYQQEKC